MGLLYLISSKRGAVLSFIAVIATAGTLFVAKGDQSFTRASFLENGRDGVEGLGDISSMAFIADRVYLSSQREHCLTVASRDKEGTLRLIESLARDRSTPVPNGARKMSSADVAAMDGGSVCRTKDGRFVFLAGGSSVLLFEHEEANALSLVTYHGESGTYIGEQPGYVRCVLSPDDQFLYATRTRDGEIEVVRFDSDQRRMTRVQTVEGLGWCTELVVTADGKNLYAASRSNRLLYAFTIDPKTGILTKCQQLKDRECGLRWVKLLTSLTASPDGEFVVATGAGNEGDVAILSRKPVSGELRIAQVLNKVKSGIADLDYPTCAAFSPDGSSLLVGCSQSDSVVVLVKRGDLFSYAETIRDASIKDPTCLSVHDGFLFVCSSEPGTLTAFRVANDKKNPGTGTQGSESNDRQ